MVWKHLQLHAATIDAAGVAAEVATTAIAANSYIKPNWMNGKGTGKEMQQEGEERR